MQHTITPVSDKLNLGCGRFKKPGLANVDTYPHLEPAVWCFAVGGFEEIEFRFRKP